MWHVSGPRETARPRDPKPQGGPGDVGVISASKFWNGGTSKRFRDRRTFVVFCVCIVFFVQQDYKFSISEDH